MQTDHSQPPAADSHSLQGHFATSPNRAGTKLIYGLTIFTSAFLLFQVEPLIAKIIVPWFGGAAAVWTVCLLFFQVVLLLGYLYAHLLAKNFHPRAQAWIHVTLIGASLIVLPIMPKDSWKPTAVGDPAIRILLLLVFTVGLPYFVLSSTSPLLQAWYSQSREGTSPYRFYALSNVSSLLALLSYPVLVEPKFSSAHQAVYWSFAYASVAILCAVVSLVSRSRIGAAPAVETIPRPSWRTQFLWIGLAACGSALLLAVTNHISQNIAAVSFCVSTTEAGTGVVCFCVCWACRWAA